MNESTLNREAWLQAAVAKLRPIFQGYGHVVSDIAVSVGWPSSGGLAKKRKTIGQCWYGTMTANNVPQLFISPLLDDVASADGVLATLVHEVVHVIAGPDAKHGPRFVKVMKQLGLTGKPTATVAGEDLIVRLGQIATDLGAFPHSKIVPTAHDRKPQGTRMKKCSCTDCGYVVRTVRKWLEERGEPICPCNKQPMKVELPEGEE